MIDIGTHPVAGSEPGRGPRSGAAVGARLWKWARRWLYILHRWIGIATCLLCAMWFVSGVVMMYVPYPELSEHDRMALRQPIDWSQVRVSPDQVLEDAGLERFPRSLRLTMLQGHPVYRIAGPGGRITVSAVDGSRLSAFDGAAALDIVRRARPEAPYPMAQTLTRDQWTVAQGFDPHRPLHKVTLNDAAETELYVSSHTGEVVQQTDRTQRFWNWLGSVPHWIYPTVLRQDGAAWRQVVMWVSGPAMLGAIGGVWIGILRLRLRRRYTAGRVSPYRGWMKWHHVSGLVAGLTLTTWLFSGWLSVDPFQLFESPPASASGRLAYAGSDAILFSGDAGLRRLPVSDAREARFLWLQDRPLMATTDSALVERLYDARSGEAVRLTDGEVARAARALVPGAPVVSATRLTEEDEYWHSHTSGRRLPVLRVEYADPAATWIHIDPTTGEVLGRTDRRQRIYRWLFDFLHDFDLVPLLHHRPAWDLLLWVLSLGGMIVSVSSVVIGWRRLGRKLSSR